MRPEKQKGKNNTMNMFYCRGLNCHLACILNIAASLDANYLQAFATLWSETDFSDNPKYHIYISKRVFMNLNALGIRIEILDISSPQEIAENLSLIQENEFFLVGMDTFHIPWSLVYQNFHGPHYFIARKEDSQLFTCFDPTYDEQGMIIKSNDNLFHAFDIARIHHIPTQIQPPQIQQEALAVLHSHPEMQKKLLDKTMQYKKEGNQNISPLINQIDAMIVNRRLFGYYFNQLPFISHCGLIFFDNDFFLQWEAIKNGFYKASVMKDNEAVLNEVCRLLVNIFQREMDIAREIVNAI